MSTFVASQRSAYTLSVQKWIARHPARAYLIMAFVFAWTSMIPLLLSRQGFGLLPIDLPVAFFNSLASFVGLALPAFLVTAATEGKEGVQALLRRCLRWRVGLHWYLVALLGAFVATVLLVLPWLHWLPLQMVVEKWPLFFTILLPGTLLPFLHTNLPEEIGWTGLLQAKLQERHGPLWASIFVAPTFALMHLPAYFVSGWIGEERTMLPEALVNVAIIAVFAIFFRLVIKWLYNGSGGSLLIAGLFHSAFNVVSGEKFTSEFVYGLGEEWSNLPVLGAVIVAAVILGLFT